MGLSHLAVFAADDSSYAVRRHPLLVARQLLCTVRTRKGHGKNTGQNSAQVRAVGTNRYIIPAFIVAFEGEAIFNGYRKIVLRIALKQARTTPETTPAHAPATAPA